MRYACAAFLATAAIAMAAAPALAAPVVETQDGHYYRLVPLKGPLPEAPPEMVTIIPGQATAAFLPASGCRLTSFENGEFQPQYTTECGPP
jgi:hypothetical protein